MGGGEGRGRGEVGGGHSITFIIHSSTDTTFPSLKVHMYVHTYNVLNDCMYAHLHTCQDYVFGWRGKRSGVEYVLNYFTN